MSPEDSTQVIEPYNVCCVQTYWEHNNPNLKGELEGDSFKRRNLQRICDHIDAVFDIGAFPRATKLICFNEFAIGGLYNPRTTVEQIKKHHAISIPGPETDVVAAKARQHKCYIALCNFENDPAVPESFFNTAFIINPEGKIILKYRKINANFGCDPHDIFDEYRDPITGKHDFFPVVDTRIGRLAVMICGDLMCPEIPRIYAMKGAEVLCHLNSDLNWEVAQYASRVRAWDNTLYFVEESLSGRIITTHDKGILMDTDVRWGGTSMIIDYTGGIIARANGTAPQLLQGEIDIMELRRVRAGKGRANRTGGGPLPASNHLTITRTELYAPYYNKSILPPNQFRVLGPMQHLGDEVSQKIRTQAAANLKGMYDFYPESEM